MTIFIFLVSKSDGATYAKQRKKYRQNLTGGTYGKEE